MRLYHATKKKYLKSILKNGLKRKQKHGYWGRGDSAYIYTTKTLKEARQWGEIVLEINATGMELRHFPEENPVWQILIYQDVPSDKIKLTP